MKIISLVGDSIFDNGAYVPHGKAVIDHMRNALPVDWEPILLAKDGAVCASIEHQAKKISSSSRVVLSIGGNDALGWRGILEFPVKTVGDALLALADMRKDFCKQYVRALTFLRDHWSSMHICTIYDCIPGLPESQKTALALFNDVIIFEALSRNIRIIDLRKVCLDEDCYSKISPIEPSDFGGKEISRAIISAILENEK